MQRIEDLEFVRTFVERARVAYLEAEADAGMDVDRFRALWHQWQVDFRASLHNFETYELLEVWVQLTRVLQGRQAVENPSVLNTPRSGVRRRTPIPPRNTPATVAESDEARSDVSSPSPPPRLLYPPGL